MSGIAVARCLEDPCDELDDRSASAFPFPSLPSTGQTRLTPPASAHQQNPHLDALSSPTTGLTHHHLNLGHPATPLPTNHPSTRKSTISRRTKAHLKVATLNMNGRGSLLPGHETNKWNPVHALLRDNKIGILALQETHLTADFVAKLQAMYGKRLVVVEPPHSQQAPSNARGVAFLLNREITNTKDFSCTELIPNRAILLTTTWHNGETIRILNVYAPNQSGENADFWQSLKQKVDDAELRPDVLLGDFNLVTDACDRIPHRMAPSVAITALQNLLEHLDLRDGWREEKPTTLEFTYPQNGARTSASRLDRIYVTEDLAKHSLAWDIEITAVPTDHKLVSVHLATGQTPYIGKGRWQLNSSLLTRKAVLADLRNLVKSLDVEVEEASRNRTPLRNPQTVYATFKHDLCQLLRRHSKVYMPQVAKEIDGLKARHDILMSDPDLATSEERRLEAALVQERIHKLEVTRHAKQRLNTAANVALTTETNSKYWTQLHRERKPRDVLYALKKPAPAAGEDPLERRSDKMAEVARDYHNNIQQPTPAHPKDRGRATRIARDSTSSVLSQRQSATLDSAFTEEDVRAALRSSALGKASGLDGLTYELWKKLDNMYHADAPLPDDSPKIGNIVKTLAAVFSDIQNHGIQARSNFTDGWMCPIYKQKGDRKDIASYRPITLLNSDYKLMTKVVASRLAQIAPTLIHTDQAGFIPGRKITDQTLLCQQMIDFAEANDENGLIVALDQEKAYDKISHDYLWKILKRFGFSHTFISLVQSLYRDATTRVAINGELSTPYTVSRGVRQGDPMSCILFDLAIEPLACMLRNSTLHGFDIPGCSDRLITKLFADDTTVYLSNDDSLSDLMVILDTWCLAADAKFNISKTKIIPVGSKPYRTAVIESRVYNEHEPPIPCGPAAPEIVPDGKPTRILGAFLGNNVNQSLVWEPVLEKITNKLAVWIKSHPSMKGKALIVQMVIGGMTQYLTSAQGMPVEIEEKLTAILRGFMWDGRQPKVKLDYLQAPLTSGGLNLLDIRSRNEAIAMVWLRTFLTTTAARPTWAFVADQLLERAARAGRRNKTEFGGAWKNPFLQSWSVPRLGKNRPKQVLAKMLDVARRYKVSGAGVKPDRKLKRAMPAWFHIGMRGLHKLIQSKPTSRCLRENHRVISMADIQRTATRATRPLRHPAHFDRSNCKCAPCTIDRRRGCKNPAGCVKTAADILNDLGQRWNPDDPGNKDNLTLTRRRKTGARRYLEDGCKLPTQFDPSITVAGPLSEVFRAFTTRPTSDIPPLRARGYHIPGRALTAAIHIERPPGQFSWSIGLHVSSSPPLRRAWTAPGGNAKLGTALATVAVVLKLAPIDVPLTLILNSDAAPSAILGRAGEWEENNWIGVSCAKEMKAVLALLRTRTAPSYLQAGSSEISIMQQAQTNLRLLRPVTDLPDLPNYQPKFLKDGMRLQQLTQASAYAVIRSRRALPPRPATLAPLDMTRQAWTPDYPVTDDRIWRASRDKAFPTYIQTFLWKCLHNAFGCGQYWANIPGRQQLEFCPRCGVTETMEHILLDCDERPAKDLWNRARVVLTRKGLTLPRLTFGHIMGIGLVSVQNPDGSEQPGATRLLKIVVSETAYLIWKLRCERRIEFDDNEEKYHSANQVSSRWRATLNKRLQLDAAAARSGLACRKPSVRLVLATWSSVLENEHSLDDDWTPLTSRVLVGIEPRRSRSRPLRISVAGFPGTSSSPTRSA